jgi:alkylresorcinol/alkylpyrone synthase
VPEHVVTIDDAKEYFPKAFELDSRRLAVVHSILENARIQKRHMLFPLDYTITPRPLDKTMCEYKTYSIEFGRCVAQEALDAAGLTPADIDLIITVSCTGMIIPSLDAYLANLMDFRSDIKRMPITELGCAAGAAALGRAHDYIRAFPEANVLIVAVELASLTLQRDDASLANLVSCCLFADGAAAAVLTGREARGLQIIGSRSHLIPNSLDAMGFDLRSSGLHIVLSKDVPELIRDQIVAITDKLFVVNGLSRDDIKFFLLHPGGQKLLTFIEQELVLSPAQTETSWRVLSDYGNLSSATVFFVMKEFLAQAPPAHGTRGLLAAFGPGFSTEMALLEWN